MDPFSQFLLSKGLVSEEVLADAQALQKQDQQVLGRLCLDRKLLSVKQVMAVLNEQYETGRDFDELAVEMGFVDPEAIQKLFKEEKINPPQLGQVLVKFGALTAKDFQAARLEFEGKDSGGVEREKSPKELMLEELESFGDDLLQELRFDIGDDLHALESTLLGDISTNPDEFGEAAFYANRIRGVATVHEVPWLPEVTQTMERICLAVKKNPPKDGSKIVNELIMASDSVNEFIQSIEGSKAQVNDNCLGSLTELLKEVEEPGEEISQEKVNAALQQEKAEAVKSTSDKPLSGRRLMIIDDNKLVRMGLSNLFSSHGAEVDQAEHGAQALEKLGENCNFDLCVVDIHMPIMDGLEFVKRARSDENFKSLPMVMFTASLTMEDVKTAGELGVEGYLLKKTPKDELVGKVVGILEKS